jgi:hypothetical protein
LDKSGKETRADRHPDGAENFVCGFHG